MKHRILIFAAAAALLGTVSCQEKEIPTFSLEDSAVCFSAASSQFSLKGNTKDWVTVEVGVTLIGPVVDYDREFQVSVVDGSAMPDEDFRIVSTTIPAGAGKGTVVMELKKFEQGVTHLKTTLAIVETKEFGLGYPAYCKAVVEWSEEYVRPEEGVWRYWYTYISHTYSRNLHELIIQIMGSEIEKYTGAASYVTKNPELTMKMPTWWYEASRTVYNAVKDHDTAHPEAPYMHSADVQRYTGYSMAVGEGARFETIPTILSTLETL